MEKRKEEAVVRNPVGCQGVQQADKVSWESKMQMTDEAPLLYLPTMYAMEKNRVQMEQKRRKRTL